MLLSQCPWLQENLTLTLEEKFPQKSPPSINRKRPSPDGTNSSSLIIEICSTVVAVIVFEIKKNMNSPNLIFFHTIFHDTFIKLLLTHKACFLEQIKVIFNSYCLLILLLFFLQTCSLIIITLKFSKLISAFDKKKIIYQVEILHSKIVVEKNLKI